MNINSNISQVIQQTFNEQNLSGSNKHITQNKLIVKVLEGKVGIGSNVPTDNNSNIINHLRKSTFIHNNQSQVVLNVFDTLIKLVQSRNVTNEQTFNSLIPTMKEQIVKTYVNSFYKIILTELDKLMKQIVAETSNYLSENTDVKLPYSTEIFTKELIKNNVQNNSDFDIKSSVSEFGATVTSSTNDTTGENLSVEQNRFIIEAISTLNKNGYVIQGKNSESIVRSSIAKDIIVRGDGVLRFSGNEKEILLYIKSLGSVIEPAINNIKVTKADEQVILRILNNKYRDGLDKYGGIVEPKTVASKLNLGTITLLKRKHLFDLDEFHNQISEYIVKLLDDTLTEELTGTSGNTFNIKEVSLEQQRELLNNKVVRLVMSKREGEYRVMWATRNLDIIKDFHQFESQEEYDDLLNSFNSNKNFIDVFDIEKGARRAYNPQRILDVSYLGTPSWVEFNPVKDAWVRNLFYSGKNVGIEPNSHIANDDSISYPTERQRIIDKLNADGRFNLEGENTEEDVRGTDEPSEVDIERIKALGRGRLNPFILTLRKHGIELRTAKTFIEPVSRYIMSNLRILDQINFDEQNEPILDDLEPLFLNELAEIYDTHGVIKSIKLEQEEMSRIKNNIVSITNEYMESFYLEASPEDIIQKVSWQEIKGIKKKYFADSELMDSKIEDYVLSVITHYYANYEVSDTGRVYDAREDLTPEDLDSLLRDKVVLVTFNRADTKPRLMWGTANSDIVQHYLVLGKGDDYEIQVEDEGEEQQRTERTSSASYIMDLELTNTPNPNRNIRFDRISSQGLEDLPNLIMLDPNKHLWYKLLNNPDTNVIDELKSRLDYSTGIVDDSDVSDDPRYIAEKERVAEIIYNAKVRAGLIDEEDEDEDEEEKQRVITEHQELRIYTYKMVNRALKSVDNWVRYDKDLYQIMLDTLESKGVPYVENEQNFEEELKMVSKNDTTMLIILQSEGVTYYINPRFMISDLGYRVFRDRTETIDFGRRALVLDTDNKHEEILTEMLNLVSKRRDSNPFQLGKLSDKNDLNRLKRLAMFTKPEILEKYGIENVKTRFISMKEMSHLEITFSNENNQTEKLLLTPASLLNSTTDQIYHQRKAKESTLSVFIESYKLVRDLLPPQIYREVGKIAQHSFDLRRKL